MNSCLIGLWAQSSSSLCIIASFFCWYSLYSLYLRTATVLKGLETCSIAISTTTPGFNLQSLQQLYHICVGEYSSELEFCSSETCSVSEFTKLQHSRLALVASLNPVSYVQCCCFAEFTNNPTTHSLPL
jgi:hypothetical protein